MFYFGFCDIKKQKINKKLNGGPRMQIGNGFIHPLFDGLITLLRYSNLVELFKFVAKYYVVLSHRPKNEEIAKEVIITACNIAIDVYQIFKWAVLIILWVCGFKSIFAELITYYLLFTNVFTYFYYHTWGSGFVTRMDRIAVNRRFINLLLSIAFYLMCYAYLYHVHYSGMISWPDSLVDFYNAVYLSVATAFTLSSDGFAANTQSIRLIFMGQHLIAFLFFAVILANSIPNHSSKD